MQEYERLLTSEEFDSSLSQDMEVSISKANRNGSHKSASRPRNNNVAGAKGKTAPKVNASVKSNNTKPSNKPNKSAKSSSKQSATSVKEVAMDKAKNNNEKSTRKAPSKKNNLKVMFLGGINVAVT